MRKERARVAHGVLERLYLKTLPLWLRRPAIAGLAIVALAGAAFQTWSRLIPREPALLPPERFHFDVVDIDD